MFTMYIVNSGKEYRGEWGRSFCRGLTKDGESRFTVSFSGIPFAQLQAESHNQSKWKVPLVKTTWTSWVKGIPN